MQRPLGMCSACQPRCWRSANPIQRWDLEEGILAGPQGLKEIEGLLMYSMLCATSVVVCNQPSILRVFLAEAFVPTQTRATLARLGEEPNQSDGADDGYQPACLGR